jgi:hypothetical protein
VLIAIKAMQTDIRAIAPGLKKIISKDFPLGRSTLPF